jgi:hypothetical protein
MRSASILAVLQPLIPFGSIAQDSPLKPDGRMWETWSNVGSQSLLVKGAYVQGTIEGLRVGAVVGYYTGRTDDSFGHCQRRVWRRKEHTHRNNSQ